MSETIYQESTGNYKYNSYSGISKECGYLWNAIKEHVEDNIMARVHANE